MTDRPTVPTVVEQQDVTYLPPTSELRAWADHPASSGYVPVHPETLRAIADQVESQARELAEANDELERERLRLAACGVAALCNTPESIARHGIPDDSPYYSASYGDVCRLVQSEMSLRSSLAAETFKRRNLDLENAGLIEHVASLAAELAAAHREREEAREKLEKVRRVSCGEDQVADDDTEGMAWIYRYLSEPPAKHTQEVGP